MEFNQHPFNQRHAKNNLLRGMKEVQPGDM